VSHPPSNFSTARFFSKLSITKPSLLGAHSVNGAYVGYPPSSYTPQPGDLYYKPFHWKRPRPPTPGEPPPPRVLERVDHIGIIEAVDPDGTLTTINGNGWIEDDPTGGWHGQGTGAGPVSRNRHLPDWENAEYRDFNFLVLG
jgi:hypothetical protein